MNQVTEFKNRVSPLIKYVIAWNVDVANGDSGNTRLLKGDISSNILGRNIPDEQFNKFKVDLVEFINRWSYSDDTTKCINQYVNIELNIRYCTHNFIKIPKSSRP